MTNRGPEPATLHLLPTLWFRNTWSWGQDDRRPNLRVGRDHSDALAVIEASHHALGEYELRCESAGDLLFTENETNLERLYGVPNELPFVKDAFHEYLVRQNLAAVNPERTGTKAAAHYQMRLRAGESRCVRLRLEQIVPWDARASRAPDGRGRRPMLPGESALHGLTDFDRIFGLRRAEADEFYAALAPACLSAEHRAIQRQALAGMLWSKQFYYYVVEEWLKGDPAQPAPPNERWNGPQCRVVPSL